MYSFCLNLRPRSHIDPSHFRKINWLPVSERVEDCMTNTVFRYWNGIVPGYIHMFKPSLCRYSTRSLMALDMPLRKTNAGQKSLSFLGPKIWFKIDSSIKNISTRSLMALDMPLRKTNAGQKSLSFLGPKIWFKIDSSIKNIRTSCSFMHAIKKNILLHLQS